MRVIYQFDDDAEGEERLIFEGAREFHSALWDIHSVIRDHLKHGSLSPEECIDEVWTLVSESGAVK